MQNRAWRFQSTSDSCFCSITWGGRQAHGARAGAHGGEPVTAGAAAAGVAALVARRRPRRKVAAAAGGGGDWQGTTHRLRKEVCRRRLDDRRHRAHQERVALCRRVVRAARREQGAAQQREQRGLRHCGGRAARPPRHRRLPRPTRRRGGLAPTTPAAMRWKSLARRPATMGCVPRCFRRSTAQHSPPAGSRPAQWVLIRSRQSALRNWLEQVSAPPLALALRFCVVGL